MCVAGKHWENYRSQCFLCGHGTWKDRHNWDTSCTDCPSGTITEETGSTALSQCICRSGYYGTSNGATCSYCSTGKFKALKGIGDCTSCAVGKRANTGKSECTDCSPGLFTDERGQHRCTECPVQTYQDEYGKTSCSSCPTGKRSSKGQKVCISCPADKYFEAGYPDECLGCSAGTY
ncbi:hypothetical protein T484DRAFT_1650832, partial [Baffinella frigidus]